MLIDLIDQEQILILQIIKQTKFSTYSVKLINPKFYLFTLHICIYTVPIGAIYSDAHDDVRPRRA